MEKQHTESGFYADYMVTVVNQKRCSDWDVDISRANYGNAHMLNTPPREPGWLGNPYRLADGYTRQEAIDNFREAFIDKLTSNDAFREAVSELETPTLACYCKPKACHGDVIKAYLNGTLDINE